MPKTVIFDLDGVLVDSTEAHYQAWRAVCERHGVSVSRETFHTTIGTNNDLTSKVLLGDVVPASRRAELSEEKEELYRQGLRDNLTIIDGAPELVENLAAAGWRLALGTSGPTANVMRVMELFPAADFLTVKVTADMVAVAKPEPDLFLKAAELSGAKPAECVVVEDSTAGLMAARRAGMAGVGLTTTLGRDQLGPLADVVVDSLRELIPDGLADLVDKNLKR